MEFREGSDHCQKNTDVFLSDTILYAKQLTTEPLLLRLDSGNDSADNIKVCYTPETCSDFIIKRNLRKENLSCWETIAKENEGTKVETPREGKKVYTGSVYWEVKGVGKKVRIVYQVIERNITAKGQILLFPDIEVQTWWTSLSIEEKKLINPVISIFPNPASDQININAFEANILDVIIYDIMGKEIKRYFVNDNKTTLDVSALQIGLYVLKIKTKEGLLTRKVQIIR